MSSFDASRLRRAIHQTAYVTRRPVQDVVKQVAKSFTKTIISITPPSGAGAAKADARQRGEAVITGDYARAFKPFDADWVDHLFYVSGRAFRHSGGSHGSHREMTDREERWKTQILAYVAAGRWSALQKIMRDMKVKRKFLTTVTKSQVDSMRGLRASDLRRGRIRADALFVVPNHGVVKDALGKAVSNVGILVNGWAPSAALLKVGMSAWMKRHHTPGTATVLDSGTGKFTITLENACSFIGNVSRYDARMDWAMTTATKNLERYMDHALRASLKKAGWH